jgi:hypothetical protein
MANPAREPDKNCQGVLVGIASASNPTYTEGHQVPLSTDLNGVLRVNATLEAGGDASAANQTTMIGHLAAIETAVEGTVDVNIVSGAGSGGTAMTDDAAFTPGTTSVTPIGAMLDNTSPDSVDEGDCGVVRMSANRNLFTTLRDAAGNERGANVNASNQLSVSVDNTVTVASHAVTNAGTFAVQVTSVAAGNNNIGDVDVASIAAGDNNIGNVDIVTVPAPLSTTGGGTEAAALRVTLASDSTGLVSVDDNGSTLSIDDGAGSITVDNGGTFAVQVSSIAAGNNNIGDVDIASIAAGNNNIGDVDIASIAAGTNTIGGTIPKTATSGGFSLFRSLDLDETEEEVKATAGQVYKIHFTNTATSTRWLKLYNATAANVTVGTTTPVYTVGLPGNTSDDISGTLDFGPQGLAFSTAITAAATTGVADNDTGAPSANDVIVNIMYA